MRHVNLDPGRRNEMLKSMTNNAQNRHRLFNFNRATLTHFDLQMDSTSLLLAWKFRTSLDATLLVMSSGA
jgi:hypothetical protein